jgi:hypothetical protein
VILDGKLFATDRLAETTTSVKGKTIDAWYSGKHHRPGANIQAVIRPDGLPAWTSDEGTGHGIHTPYKQPTGGTRLAPDNRAYNALLRSLHCQGERGFALLTGRWHALRHTTASPRKIGDHVRAGLVLTHFEYRYLPSPC